MVLNLPLTEEEWTPCIHNLEGHKSYFASVAWPQDDSGRLASWSWSWDDALIKIWDSDTGQCLHTLTGHTKTVCGVAWSPDQSVQLASWSDDYTIKIWNSNTGQCLYTLSGHTESVMEVVWSPDQSGRLASLSSDKTAKIWDSARGKCFFTLEGLSGSLRSTSWSKNGERIALASADMSIKVWDMVSCQCVSTLKGHNEDEEILWISWSPTESERLASASYSGSIKVWDSATRQCIFSLGDFNTAVTSIFWLPEGSTLGITLGYGTFEAWDLAANQLKLLFRVNGPKKDYPFSVHWSKAGRRLVLASFEEIIVWDMAKGNTVSKIKGLCEDICSIALSADGARLASASSDGTVKIWDPATSHDYSIIDGHTQPPDYMNWSPDGRKLASTSSDMKIKIWDATDGKCILTLERHGDISLPDSNCYDKNPVKWSPDGNQLSSISVDKVLRIWDPATGRCQLVLGGEMRKIESHTWSPDGKKIATGSQNNTAHIWDSSTGKLLFTLNEDSPTHRDRQSPVLVVWSPDGTQVASKSHDTAIRIWDPMTAQCKLTLTRDDIMSENDDYWENISLDSWGNEYNPDYMGSTIDWSPDGIQIVCCGFDDDYWGNMIRVWNLHTGTCLFSCQVDPKPLFLRFDETPNHINTSWGVLDFGCPVLDPTIEPFTVHCSESGPSGYSFSKDYLWITYNGTKILWLPPEYRPELSSVAGTSIAINCSMYRILIIQLTDQNPISLP